MLCGPQGHAYIDSSTVDEDTGESIGAALLERQARFLAAPVSGGWRDAAKGEVRVKCVRAVASYASADACHTPHLGACALSYFLALFCLCGQLLFITGGDKSVYDEVMRQSVRAHLRLRVWLV